MHKNWVINGYDQCVTFLPDDPQNLVTHSSTLRTPRILSQTNNSVHKHSSKDARVKLQIIRSNLKAQLKRFDLQKESNKMEVRN